MKIIAEIGMNHMGSQVYAYDYLSALCECLARPDGITFQVREKSYYDGKPTTSLQLSDEFYKSAVRQVKDYGIRFGIALCDVERLSFFEDIGTDFYKILSKDIGDKKLVDAVLATGKPVYVSTGMSSEEEVAAFLASFGGLIPPKLTLIHTQLSYDEADTNLRAIKHMREKFGVPVAFGSHSMNVNAIYASLGFSPSAVFFYVKGERPLKHGDDQHAVALPECASVVWNIQRLQAMLGTGVKQKMENRIADQKK